MPKKLYSSIQICTKNGKKNGNSLTRLLSIPMESQHLENFATRWVINL